MKCEIDKPNNDSAIAAVGLIFLLCFFVGVMAYSAGYYFGYRNGYQVAKSFWANPEQP